MAIFSKLTKSTEKTIFPWTQRKLGGTSNTLPRYGHAATALASDHVAIFGGIHQGSTKKDLVFIDTNNLSASCVNTFGDVPNSRSYPILVTIGSFILMYGGEPTGTDDRWDPNFYIFNQSSRQWVRVQMEGALPTERSGHSAFATNGVVYIWGGQRSGRYLNDLLAFNTSHYPANPRWEFLTALNAGPSGRAGHVSVIYDNKFYIFGGTDGDHLYNDIWCFDFQTQLWAPVPAAGYIPVPRKGCSSCLMDDVLYVNGGQAADGQFLGDLCAFKIKTQRWYMFQNMGPAPAPRRGLTMTAVREKMLVVGGESGQTKLEDASMGFVLDSAKIRYPSEAVVQAPPAPSLSSASSHSLVDSEMGPSSLSLSSTTPSQTAVRTIIPPTQPQTSPNTNPSPLALQTDAPIKLSINPNSNYHQQEAESPLSSDVQSSSASVPESSLQKTPVETIPQQAVKPPRHNAVPEAALRRPRAVSPMLNLEGDSNITNHRYAASLSPISPAESTDHSLLGHSYAQRLLGSRGGEDGSTDSLDRVSTGNTTPVRPHPPRHPYGPLSPPPRPSREGVNLANPYSQPLLQSNEPLLDTSTEDTPVQPSTTTTPSSPSSIDTEHLTTSVEHLARTRRADMFLEEKNTLLKEIKTRDQTIHDMKKKEQWWRTEVSLARKQYAMQGNPTDQGPEADEAMLMALVDLQDEKRVLFEQLVAMKSELRNVRASIGQQVQPMSEKLNQADLMRTAALQEAAYFKSKYLALKSRQTNDLVAVETERASLLEKRLTLVLKENESNGKLLLQLQRRAQHDHSARVSAEERAKEAHERAEEAQEAHQRALEELSVWHGRTTRVEAQMRENTAKMAELTQQLAEALSVQADAHTHQNISEVQLKVSQLEAANLKSRNEAATLKQRLAESLDDIARLRTLLNEREESLLEATRNLEDSEIQLSMMKEAMSQKFTTTRAY
ncbi:hypothetical protein BDF14DRAFT_1769756 [Spinellus fusiger]|nr:hypothetical protein BDF14DRAFT_1769756 [Spinellus fusiger]